MQSAVSVLKSAKEKSFATYMKTERGERLSPDDIKFLRELIELEKQSGMRFGGSYANEALRAEEGRKYL